MGRWGITKPLPQLALLSEYLSKQSNLSGSPVSEHTSPTVLHPYTHSQRHTFTEKHTYAERHTDTYTHTLSSLYFVEVWMSHLQYKLLKSQDRDTDIIVFQFNPDSSSTQELEQSSKCTDLGGDQQ